LPEKKIPIWLGGFKEVALKRAAAIGDGFIFGSGQKENLAGWGSLKKHLKDANRDDSDFGVEALLNFQSGPERWRQDIEAWIDAGASHVSMRAMALRGQGEGLKTPTEHIKILETYWKGVGELAG